MSAMQKERMDTVLAVENVGKQVSSPEGTLTILDGISFDIARGETVAVVGAVVLSRRPKGDPIDLDEFPDGPAVAHLSLFVDPDDEGPADDTADAESADAESADADDVEVTS